MCYTFILLFLLYKPLDLLCPALRLVFVYCALIHALRYTLADIDFFTFCVAMFCIDFLVFLQVLGALSWRNSLIPRALRSILHFSPQSEVLQTTKVVAQL